MGLFNIAFKNIKGNFYNYFLYFVSMIFSIMIYFTFTSIQYNTQVLDIVGGSMQLAIAFKAASVVIAIFAAMFMWYSNSFFTRKRKKEVALYSLLGIRKKQIGRMLFYENLVMGILALASGIAIGGLLSKLFIMLLINLMGFSGDIKFMISFKAILDTALVFAVLFLITSLHSYTLIYRFKLIELFKSENTREKEPKSSIIFSILAIVLIGYGYFIYLDTSKGFNPSVIFITLGLTVLGTYALFSSLTLLVIKLSRKNKKRYYSGINMIGTSQLLYRIKGSARTLATIAVLSATTLTAMEVTASLYYDFTTKLNNSYGFTYAYASKDKELDKKVEKIIAKYPKNKLLNSVDMEFLKVKGNWPNLINVKTGTGLESKPISEFYIISESKYNEIAKARGLQYNLNLNTQSEALVFDEQFVPAFMRNYTGETITIDQGKEKLNLQIEAFKTHTLANQSMMSTVAVVKDEVYNKSYKPENVYRIKGYITDNRKDSAELTKEITALMPKTSHWPLSYSSYYSQYRGGLAASGATIFIGAFLGLVFLAATGSIIFFKQLSEANDDKNRYKIIKNIGVTNKEIKSSISKQILIVFLLPLIVGITHSLVASSLLSRVFNTDFTIPIFITMGAYTFIYMLYYFLTVNSYYNIVNGDN